MAERNQVMAAPYLMLVEVVSAVKRRTGDDVLSRRTTNDLRDHASIQWYGLDRILALSAAALSIRTGLRGALVLPVHTLITAPPMSAV